MTTDRPLRLLPLLAACALLPGVAACGTGSSTGQTTVTVTAEPEQAPTELDDPGTAPLPEPASPIPILKKVKGCTPQAGTEVGERDIDGNRYASCDFFDMDDGTAGTVVTVRTYPGDPREYHPDPSGLTSDDSNKVILGPDFSVIITGDWANYSRDIDPKVIADQVGGTYAPGT